MNSLIIAFGAGVLYLIAYHTYGRFIARRLFGIGAGENVMPAHEFNDGVDYAPANRFILFGHHYTSIAGTG